MEIIAAIASRAGLARILEHMGLPTEPPALHPSGPPPQTDLPFDIPAFAPDPPAPDDFDL